MEYKIDIMDTEETCAFDKLLKNNVPHLPQKIFLSLDLKSFKSCLNVSNGWNKLLTSESIQRKAECVFLKDAMRQEEKLLCSKIKVAQLTQRSKEMLETIGLNMILFCLIGCSFLIFEYLSLEEIRACQNIPRCQNVPLLHIFFIIYNLYCLMICTIRSWSKFTEYQSKWAQEWKNILKTEQYETMVTSVFHHYIQGKTNRSDLTLFYKDILKKEEDFRLNELGSIRKVRAFTVFNVLFVITFITLIGWPCIGCGVSG